MKTTWIDTAGGPLICAAYLTAMDWRGTRSGSIGESRSDYDRACEVMDYVGVVPCASSSVLVFGDEPLQTTFVNHALGLVVVRWVSCASADDADGALAAIPTALPQLESPKSILIESERLVLFDAAYAFDMSPKSMEAKIAPGLYEVSTEKFASPGVFEFLVHRMLRTSGSTV